MMGHDYDVIVAGGGPAGIGAAITAARRGARTLMIEKNPFAGGTWTAGTMLAFLDHANKGGITGELRERLDAYDAWVQHEDKNATGLFAPEAMKLVLDELLTESGVEVRYQTFLYGAKVSHRRLAAVETASKSGRELWGAGAFVDATGDGDLAAFAGCGFDLGRPSDGGMQPASMHALVGGLPEPLPTQNDILEVLDRAGFDLSYDKPGLSAFPGRAQGMALLGVSHLYGVDPTDAAALTRAEMAGRRQVHDVARCLRQHGGLAFAQLVVVATGPFVAIREGRRIHGLYTVTEGDARAGRAFEDGICEVTFNFDVHHVKPEEGRSYWYEAVPPYQIPYRSLVARDLDNLLLSGRCISGDFVAHSSYRVVGDAVPLGEAAGAAAAITVDRSISAAQVSATEVSQIVETR